MTWRWAPGIAGATLAACVAVLSLATTPALQEPVEASVVRLPPASRSASAVGAGRARVEPPAGALPSLGDFATYQQQTVASARRIAPAPVLPQRVLVVGDSTGVHLARELMHQAEALPSQLLVASAAFPGCGLSVADDGRQHESTGADGRSALNDLSGCSRQWSSVPERIAAEAIDVVVVRIGAWDGTDIHLADGDVVSVVTDRGSELVADSYRAFAESVESAGARLVWVLPPDLRLGWGQLDTVLDDPDRWSALRAIIRPLPGADIDLGGWLEAERLSSRSARPDGVHLSPEVEARFVTEAVIPAVFSSGAPHGQTG